MDPTVKIIVDAVDRASSEILKINTEMALLGKNATNSDRAMAKLGKAIAVGRLAFTAISEAIKPVIKFTKESVNETIAYNKQIRELGQVTGISADAISRIVQVGDDWGISIESIRTSLAFMNKQGITPSIDNLAKLADEYVNTSDKSAFAEKAVKTLGRGYQTLIPLLALGGQGLRDATAAIDENLIATDDSIKASRRYEVAVDSLNDSWQAIKYTVGNDVIPVLADLLDSTNELISRNKSVTETAEKLEIAFKAGAITEEDYIKIRHDLMYSTDGLITAQVALTDANKKQFTAVTMLYPEEERFIGLYDALYGGTVTLTDGTDDLISSVYELRDAAGEAESMMAKYKDQLIFNLVAAGLNKEQQFQLADSMGLIDEQTRLAYIGVANLTEKYDLNKNGVIDAKEATDAYTAGLLLLKGAIDGIPASKDVEIRVRTIYSETGRPSGFEEHNYSRGGSFIVPPGYPNDSYRMNVESGEVVTVQKAGNTTNNSFTQNIHTNAQSSTLMRDFNFMKAMAG